MLITFGRECSEAACSAELKFGYVFVSVDIENCLKSSGTVELAGGSVPLARAVYFVA